MKRHHRLHELSFHLVLISNGIESLTNFQFVAAISPPILPTLKHLCRRPFIRNLGTFAVNIIKPSTIHPPSSHRFSIPSTLMLDREKEREREGAPVRLHRPVGRCHALPGPTYATIASPSGFRECAAAGIRDNRRARRTRTVDVLSSRVTDPGARYK